MSPRTTKEPEPQKVFNRIADYKKYCRQKKLKPMSLEDFTKCHINNETDLYQNIFQQYQKTLSVSQPGNKAPDEIEESEIECWVSKRLQRLFCDTYTTCQVKKRGKYHTYALEVKEKSSHELYTLSTLLARSGAKTDRKTSKQFDIAYGRGQAKAVLKRYKKAEASRNVESDLLDSRIGTGLCEPVSYDGRPRRSYEKQYKALFYSSYFLNHEKVKKQIQDMRELDIKEALKTSINVSIALTREYYKKDRDSIYRGERLGFAEGEYKASELQKMIEPLKEAEFNLDIKKTIYTNVRLIENIVPEVNKRTGKVECVNIKFSGLFFHNISKINRSFVLIPPGMLERLQGIKNEMYSKERKEGAYRKNGEAAYKLILRCLLFKLSYNHNKRSDNCEYSVNVRNLLEEYYPTFIQTRQVKRAFESLKKELEALKKEGSILRDWKEEENIRGEKKIVFFPTPEGRKIERIEATEI